MIFDVVRIGKLGGYFAIEDSRFPFAVFQFWGHYERLDSWLVITQVSKATAAFEYSFWCFHLAKRALPNAISERGHRHQKLGGNTRIKSPSSDLPKASDAVV